MKIALAQTNRTIADFEEARQQILEFSQQAANKGADLIVFPELATFGYPPRDLLDRHDLVDAQWLLLQSLAKELCLPAIIGCVEPLHEGAGPMMANALVVIHDGEIVDSYRKQLLPTYDVFDERRYFRQGDESGVVSLLGRRIGLSICEDIWSEDFSGIRYQIDPLADLQDQCDLLINISASPFCRGRAAMRHRLVQSVAKRMKVPVVYVNQVGGQDELLFDGGSCAFGPDGTCYASAQRWQEDLVIADLEQAISPAPAIDELADLYEGLVCGLRDYCRKTRQRGVVLGLSGGIDSALVATLAVDALGADRVHGLLMPGPYSSQGSIDDAQALVDNLGITAHTCTIAPAYDAILKALEPAFAGTTPNVAEENIQARLRGNLVMAYANKFGLMALTTGNKSELAVGYCTIYGDMAGGLAPIGDVYKLLVWDLARYANSTSERIPDNSISKPPSAELRPDQRDTDTLPSYEILDAILTAYLEKGASRSQLEQMGHDPRIISLILGLVERNEYKRWQ
ncbi:MAG: NAD+ synthase, partial [Planctomycetota bacterium]